MEKIYKGYIMRMYDLENHVLPFVGADSIEEELAYNELLYVKNQINAIHKYLKNK